MLDSWVNFSFLNSEFLLIQKPGLAKKVQVAFETNIIHSKCFKVDIKCLESKCSWVSDLVGLSPLSWQMGMEAKAKGKGIRLD